MRSTLQRTFAVLQRALPGGFCKAGGKVAGIAKAYFLCGLADTSPMVTILSTVLRPICPKSVSNNSCILTPVRCDLYPPYRTSSIGGIFICRKRTADQREKAIVAYIDYCNNRRIKLKLNGLSPVQYRIQTVQIAKFLFLSNFRHPVHKILCSSCTRSPITMGLDKKPFMPLSSALRRSSSKALAVMARIGSVARAGSSSARICRVAV